MNRGQLLREASAFGLPLLLPNSAGPRSINARVVLTGPGLPPSGAADVDLGISVEVNRALQVPALDGALALGFEAAVIDSFRPASRV